VINACSIVRAKSIGLCRDQRPMENIFRPRNLDGNDAAIGSSKGILILPSMIGTFGRLNHRRASGSTLWPSVTRARARFTADGGLADAASCRWCDRRRDSLRSGWLASGICWLWTGGIFSISRRESKEIPRFARNDGLTF